VGVIHKAYAWTDDGFRKFVIVEYKIKNEGTGSIDSLYAGIFADWDIMNLTNNKASFDGEKRMGYIYNTDSAGLWAGIKLLSPGTANCNSIDNTNGGGGGINMFDGFSDADKYWSLSTQRDDAGGTGTGNDVIHVVSSGPFSLLPDSSVIIAFALIAGESLSDIQASADAAQFKYDVDVPNGIPDLLSENDILLYPNPATEVLNIVLPDECRMQISECRIINSVGELIYQSAIINHQSAIDISSVDAGIYFCHIQTNTASFNRKIIVIR
jgi:serine protease